MRMLPTSSKRIVVDVQSFYRGVTPPAVNAIIITTYPKLWGAHSVLQKESKSLHHQL